MGLVRILVVILLLLPSMGWAACSWEGSTGTVASPYAPADVQACVDTASAKTGDVVISIPGSATWSGTAFAAVAINMTYWAADKVTIAGAGKTTTVLTITKTGNSYAFNVTGKDGIGFEVKDIGVVFGDSAVANFLRLSGGIGRTSPDTKGINIHGCSFTRTAGLSSPTAIMAAPRIYGVIHNNTFSNVRVLMTYFSGGLTDQDYEWTQAAGLGGNKFIFIERNEIELSIDAIDGLGAPKTVTRYNNFTNTYWMTHGGTPDCVRGYRALEVYNNIFSYDGSRPASVTRPFFLRSGSGVIHNNTLDGTLTGVSQYIEIDYELACNTCCFDANNPTTALLARSTTGVNLAWDTTTDPSCSTYPCQDQIGMGQDTGWGTEQTVEGLYAWNNTTPTGNMTIRLNPAACAATSTIIQANRDYFNVASVTAAKAAGLAADYATYTCPHPLAGTGTCGSGAGITEYSLGSVNPTLVSATLAADGTSLSLLFSRAITTTINTGVTVTPSSGAATATYASGTTTTTLVYTISRAISSTANGGSLTVSYTQPGNGLEATDDGQDVLGFTNTPVINNSTQGNNLKTVTPSAGTGCNIFPATAVTVVDGLTATFNVSPNANYSISSITGTCGGTGTTTFTTSAVTADCTVIANCTKNAAEGKVGAGNSGQKIGAGNPAHKRY
jgi:hypothetical protein